MIRGRVAARGMGWPQVRDLDGWRSLLRVLAGSAREQSAGLLLLPGLLGLKLLDLGGPWQFGPELSRIVHERRELLEAGLAIAREAAVEFGIFLAPGSYLLPAEDGGMWHTAILYDAAGREILRADETHPSQKAAAWGVKSGERLPLTDSPWGKIGFLLGEDAWVPEVGRILALEGADLFLAPVTRSAPYREEDQMWGTWAQVQGNQVFAVECGLWGLAGDQIWSHRTAAFAPCEITEDETGMLARPGEEQLAVELDPAELGRIRREYPLVSHLNLDLYRRNLPRFWEEEPR